MRKIFYLCGMMLLCMDMMAQIDLDDKNWERVLCDDFTYNYWDTWARWEISYPNPTGYYYSYLKECNSGVTHGDKEYQVYQRENCQFGNGEMRLVSTYVGGPNELSLQCGDYDLPPGKICDPSNRPLFYTSGNIQTTTKYKYGYFEIKCRLPIHSGAFPAFWLWDASKTNLEDQYYEEIDIFEYSWGFENYLNEHNNHHPHGAGNPFCFTTGIYYNDTVSYHIWQNSRARNFPMITDSLNHWHTFACEWMPEHVIWYCDGNAANEYHNPDSIPKHTLTLKTNYAIDKYAFFKHNPENPLIWKGSDSLVIDYVKVYQLKCDCDTDEIIACQAELDGFDYKVKKSVSITSTLGNVKLRASDKVTFRATDSFEIIGPFQVDSGGELTVIMQDCPE